MFNLLERFGCFARLEANLEAFSTLQDDVGLQFEIWLLKVGVDAEIPKYCWQDNFQLQHGVFATFGRNIRID